MYHRIDVSVVKFLIRIPCSVYNGSRTVSTILQYGHGLFGSRAEANGEYLGKIANKYGMIIVATDWKGMSKYDVPMVYLFVVWLLFVIVCCCCQLSVVVSCLLSVAALRSILVLNSHAIYNTFFLSSPLSSLLSHTPVLWHTGIANIYKKN